jgi:hypothetical protein
MNFDDLQKTWSQQGSMPRLSVHADALLPMVRRSQSDFAATIFWRDFREVGVALVLVIIHLRSYLRNHDWIEVLLALACFGVGTFMLVDRLRQRRKTPAMSAPLKACIEQSLHQVRHQVWLLRNVLWWYILPIALPVFLSIYLSSSDGTVMARRMGICGLLTYGIYLLNRYAVKKSLEPRQRELESLLASIDEPDSS